MDEFLQVLLAGVAGGGDAYAAQLKKKADDEQAIALSKAQRGGKLQDAIALEMVKQKLNAGKGKNGVNYDYNDILSIDENGTPVIDMKKFNNISLRPAPAPSGGGGGGKRTTSRPSIFGPTTPKKLSF